MCKSSEIFRDSWDLWPCRCQCHAVVSCGATRTVMTLIHQSIMQTVSDYSYTLSVSKPRFVHFADKLLVMFLKWVTFTFSKASQVNIRNNDPLYTFTKEKVHKVSLVFTVHCGITLNLVKRRSSVRRASEVIQGASSDSCDLWPCRCQRHAVVSYSVVWTYKRTELSVCQYTHSYTTGSCCTVNLPDGFSSELDIKYV